MNADSTVHCITGTVRHIGCRFLLCVFAMTIAMVGCDSSTQTSTTAQSPPEDATTTTIERGPVKVTVTVTPKKARLSDEPTLTLSIEHETKVDVTKPAFGADFGPFQVLDFKEPLPTTVGDRQLIQQVYKLEPMITGTLTISPIAITFKDNRPNGDGKQHTIETDPLQLEVTTMLASEAPSLNDLKPLTAPVEIDAPASKWPWIIGAAIGVLLLSALLVAFFAKRIEDVIPVISAEDEARAALNSLVATKVHTTDVKDFYVRLTAIVRRYIERTTNVSAPEQTTDEFLRATADHPAFSLEKRSRFRDFLESADLVKYAALNPNEDDIESAIQRARHFTTPEKPELQETGT